MDKKEFLKLKKQIDKILSQAEDEALGKGIVITDPEFQALLFELKKKLLEERGISLKDFELAEAELEDRKDIEEDEVIKLGKRTKTFPEACKKEFKEKTEELINNFRNEIQNLSSSLRGEMDNTRKSALTENDIVGIVKPLIPIIPKHTDFDHSGIIEKIDDVKKNLEERIREMPTEHNELKNIKPDDHHKEKHTIASHDTKATGEQLNRLVGKGFVDDLHKHIFPTQPIVQSGGGVKTFIMLWDAPNSYSGQGGKGVRVNSNSTGLEFYTISDVGGVWGTITGILSNQIDLQTALNAKADSLSGTINEIAYFDSATTISSLAVATYPSLTELSYVKGVISAIQTQLDNKQPLDATLTSVALLGTAADKLAYTTGVDTWAETALTAAGRALIDDADAATQRTTLGLVIGTNVQAWDADLDTWATKTAPSGTVIGTTDTQTLTNKRVNP